MPRRSLPVIFGLRLVSACHSYIPAHNIQQEHCFASPTPNLAASLPPPVIVAEVAI